MIVAISRVNTLSLASDERMFIYVGPKPSSDNYSFHFASDLLRSNPESDRRLTAQIENYNKY